MSLNSMSNPQIDEAMMELKSILVKEMIDGSHWEGHLSSSALSNATALSALSFSNAPEDGEKLHAGLEWLFVHQNSDGGWGDTTDSPSNLSTTLLVNAAFRLNEKRVSELKHPPVNNALQGMKAWLNKALTNYDGDVARGVLELYGADRTFSAPILMNCALAGLVDWRCVPDLPYELAAVPQGLFKFLKLGVVSYALPALIAIGMLVEQRKPTANPFSGAFRQVCIPKVMEKLQEIQPSHGGFLDATPLTSFVAMALANRFDPQHPINQKCFSFLRWSMRPDGSWPIDTNLSVWITSHIFGLFEWIGFPSEIQPLPIKEWLYGRRQLVRHPYTGADPGGWGWNHHPGSVPDADDTSAVLIALYRHQGEAREWEGLKWLLRLQNNDGGWPTFCKGWSGLPFDRSCPDITAHALRAISPYAKVTSHLNVSNSIRRGLEWLKKNQHEDGSWVPLWFGNQYAPNGENRVVGTSRVLLALGELNELKEEREKGIHYLLNVQNDDGGWGGGKGISPTMEETSLSVIALLACGHIREAERGVEYLLGGCRSRAYENPAPIGLYFTSLWYSEKLYPIIWTLEALGRYKLQKNEMIHG